MQQQTWHHCAFIIVVGNNQIKLLTVDEGNTALSSLFDFMTKIADNINEAMDKNSKNQNPNIDIDDNMNIH